MNDAIEKEKKEVLVFGAFDVLHEGHKQFLKQAKALGDWLVVALASDANIAFIKNHPPKEIFPVRAEALNKLDSVDQVVEGDSVANNDDEYGSTFGEWSVINEMRPAIVAFGYDQSQIQELFTHWLAKYKKQQPAPYLDALQIVTLAAFEPEKYKSSLLNGK